MFNKLIDFFNTDSLILDQRMRYLERNKSIQFFFKINLAFLKYLILYRQRSNKFQELDYVFWCSDETQLKNQLPVVKILTSNNFKVVVLSNKKRICNLLDILNVGNLFVSTDYLLGSKKGLIKLLWNYIVKIISNKPALKWAIVGNDLRWDDRLICKAFQLNKIKVAVINHGLNHFPERMKNIICDTHFAWSDKEKSLMSKSGCNPNRVQVSGSPALDEIFFGESDPNQSLVDQFIAARVYDHQDIILISFSGSGGQISEGNHQKNIAYLKNQSEALKKHNFVALIKLHPKDQPHYYLELLDTKVFHLIPKEDIKLNGNIFLWIKRAFALVSGPSTTMIDAMVMSKPAIYCDLDREGVKVEFVENDIVPIISPNHNLIDILHNFKHDPQALTKQIEKQSHFLQSIYKKPDGLSASRIAEYLTKHG